MAINWGSVFSTIIDVTAAVGLEAMKYSAVENAVEKCRYLPANDVVAGFTQEVVQMDEEVWGAWQRHLFLISRNGDQTAEFMSQIGKLTRREMNIVAQIAQYTFEDAVNISIERIRSQSPYEQICFIVTLASLGRNDLKLDMITKRLVRLLSSG